MTNSGNNVELCCICGEIIEGYGNNAEPIEVGRCCDECDYLVLEARLKQIDLSQEQIDMVLNIERAFRNSSNDDMA